MRSHPPAAWQRLCLFVLHISEALADRVWTALVASQNGHPKALV
jgi:hypothetical protein